MKEVWKSIEGYEGLYEVSDLGNVKSLSRKKWSGKVYYKSRGKLLNPSVNNNGYLIVGLSKITQRKTFGVHTLVFDGFSKQKRNGRKLQVDHINGIKTDNRFTNLQLLTQRANIYKAYQQNGKKTPPGVSYEKRTKRYESNIRVNGKKRRIGRYSTSIEAGEAYQNELNKLGERETE